VDVGLGAARGVDDGAPGAVLEVGRCLRASRSSWSKKEEGEGVVGEGVGRDAVAVVWGGAGEVGAAGALVVFDAGIGEAAMRALGTW